MGKNVKRSEKKTRGIYERRFVNYEVFIRISLRTVRTRIIRPKYSRIRYFWCQ